MIFRILLFSFGLFILQTESFSQTKTKSASKKTPAKNKLPEKNQWFIQSKNAYEFKYSLGEKKRDSSLLYTKKYNEKGNLIEDSSPYGKISYVYEKGKLSLETSYHADNSFHSKDIYLYDSPGNLQEKTEYDASEKIIFKAASKFNAKNQEIEKIISDSTGKMQARQTFSYDEKGDKTEEAEYDSSSVQTGKKIINYDSKNNITLMLLMKKDSVTAKYVYEYNEGGLKTKTICYESDGSINYKTNYEYDAKKNLLSEITYQRAGTTRIVWNYDAKGNKISEIKYDGAGNVLSKTIYKYNAKNLPSEEIQYDLYDEPSSAIKYYYEYFSGK
ncbi:MAG: hypothetical protein HY063_14775 [Bacteroidetes bacterium]|nr:hypothetical protein [Bacteroidota bacterium]